MKRGIIIFMTLLPVAAMGRQRDLGLPSHDLEPAISEQTDGSLPRGNEETSLEITNISESNTALDQGPAPTPAQKGKAPQPQPQTSKPGGEITSPSIGGSMVGYIDNAIVGSEIVVRFENEIQNLTPDLAEFLYPKCNCAYTPEGPGPPVLVTNLNTEVLHMYGEYALNRRFSVFAEVPVRWIQPQSQVFLSGSRPFANQSGLSDVMAGFKLAILASAQHYVTIEMQSFFPSGNGSLGLGTDHYSVQASILYYQRVTRRLSLESEFGELHPIGGSAGFSSSGSSNRGGFAGDILDYGVGPSYKLFNGNRVQFTPLVEFIGWRLLGGFQTVSAFPGVATPVAGSNILNLKGGARVTFGAHNSIYAGYGRSLTGLYWYLRVFRLEYRYSF